MQPQITVSLALAQGTSIVTESIFDNRFKYVDELAKMGSNIKVEGNTAIIVGVEKFTSANLTAPDLCLPVLPQKDSAPLMISNILNVVMRTLM